MKKSLIILTILCFILSITGCGIVKKVEVKTAKEQELTPEEKYDVALDSFNKSDYTHTVLFESYGNYSSDITEYKFVVDKDNKVVTKRISSSKYKTSSMNDYEVSNLPGTLETQLSYNDFSTNKSISYDFQCGSGWNYYSMPDKTYTGVDSVYGMVVMMTKELEGTVDGDNYSFNLTEAKIKEVTGEIFPTKDGNVNVVVTLDGNKVKSMVMNYTSLYGTGKHTVTFDKIGDQNITMSDKVKNAKLMNQGQSCY